MSADVTVIPESIDYTALRDGATGLDAGVELTINGVCRGEPITVKVPLFSHHDALGIGAELIAWSDYLAGRKVRDWQAMSLAG